MDPKCLRASRRNAPERCCTSDSQEAGGKFRSLLVARQHGTADGLPSNGKCDCKTKRQSNLIGCFTSKGYFAEGSSGNSFPTGDRTASRRRFTQVHSLGPDQLNSHLNQQAALTDSSVKSSSGNRRNSCKHKEHSCLSMTALSEQGAIIPGPPHQRLRSAG